MHFMWGESISFPDSNFVFLDLKRKKIDKNQYNGKLFNMKIKQQQKKMYKKIVLASQGFLEQKRCSQG